ncbi:MAG: hypothetical protein ACE3JP_03375 [Ectobacillus sp.]
MEKYFVQVNGNLWVTHAWSSLNKVQLSTNREDVEETISKTEIEWLKTIFKDVRVFGIALVEVSMD